MVVLISRTFNIAFEKFSSAEQQRLRVRFADPLLQAFFDIQVEEAQAQLVDIDPSGYPPAKATEFLQACQEARSVLQFWRELSLFVKDWSTTQGE